MTALRASTLPPTGAALVDAFLRHRGPATAPTDAHDLVAFCRWLTAANPDRRQ